MIDPVVERQYSDCRELLGLWKTFHDFFVMGVKGENLTPEKEAQFLEIKSRIAMLHDSFLEALTHDQNIGQEVLNIVSRTITLKHLNRQSAADVKKMEIEWHESYLLLNETIGALEDKRNELSKVNQAQYRAGKAGAAARQKFTTFFTSAGFKLVIVIAGVLFGTVGVQWLGIWDWQNLGKYPATRTPYAMGLKTWRYVVNADTPWKNIESYDLERLPVTSWPAGVKEPKQENETQDAQVKSMPFDSKIKDALSRATQYRLETTTKNMEGKVKINTFLMPDTQSAKTLQSDWEEYIVKNTSVAQNWFLDRNVNIITMATSDNQGLLNNVRVNIYMQR